MLADRTTLAQFLAGERRHSNANHELHALILDIADACEMIAEGVAQGALTSVHSTNGQGEAQKRLDVAAYEIVRRANESGGYLAGMVSDAMQAPYSVPGQSAGGKYLLVLNRLDGASDIAVNLCAGTLFSVLRAPDVEAVTGGDFLQPGALQVGAGYALYGPATVLVICVGGGVHGFTLDPGHGEFILTHPHLRVPSGTSELAVNTANSRFWNPAVKRYVGECLAGRPSVRGSDFDMHWSDSLVAETHRVLLRGGVCLYPLDTRESARTGRPRLLYEANPVSFIVERAGGRASTGHGRVLDVVPGALHQPTGLVFGPREEVERIEQYHHDRDWSGYDAPLFNLRGLFRTSI